MSDIGCSVLMPVLNEEHHIRASVNAMRRQRFDGALEFIVIDGGSSDGTRQILESLAAEDDRIVMLDNPRRIAASALNVGLGAARGRWIARMDAHTEYREDYVALGVGRLERGGTSWVSGPPIPRGTGRVSRAVALALRTPLGRGASRKWVAELSGEDGEYELDAGVFAGVWERETLLWHGGWDEEWVVNQDSEMAGRFLAQGERLICLMGMAAYYAPRNSLMQLWRQYLRYGEYRERTAVRHPHTMRRSHLLAPGVATTVLAGVLPVQWMRRMARYGLATYACALAAAGTRALSDAEHEGDSALVPIVLATMHLGHGFGFLRGAVRYGPPTAAIARVFGLKRLAAELTPASRPVFAPSLGGHSGERSVLEGRTSRGSGESRRWSAR